MRIPLTGLAAALAALAAPTLAHAGEGLRGFLDEGFYAHADIGLGLEADQELTGVFGTDYGDPLATDFLQTLQGEAELPDGMQASLGFGWSSQQSGLRIEGLFVHDRREETISGVNLEYRASGLYGVALYDFNRFGRAQTFLGAGIGANNIEYEISGIGEVNDTALSFLGTAGLGFVVNDHLMADVIYRYIATPDVRFEESDVDPISGDRDYARLDAEAEQHAVLIGLRYMVKPPALAAR
ncbi:MAG: outer membrane beta-barrel protein [Hyphomonadaceae bacterium]|nr:outer membrane beta-barrel protein [Hyphomonadaceae bacterium]